MGSGQVIIFRSSSRALDIVHLYKGKRISFKISNILGFFGCGPNIIQDILNLTYFVK